MSNNNYEDQTLQCVECGASFVFTGEDQDYHAQKNYSTPKRCPKCRANRRQSGGGGGSKFGGRSSAPRQLYNVVCDGCGCETQVPFKPNSDKPVYCKDCFRNS